MKKKFQTLAILLSTPWFFGTASSNTIQCRAEAANIIAGLKSESSVTHQAETLALATQAALIMCERKIAFKKGMATKGAMPITSKNDEPDDTVTEEKKRTGFLGLSFGNSKRSEGHRRLQKKN